MTDVVEVISPTPPSIAAQGLKVVLSKTRSVVEVAATAGSLEFLMNVVSVQTSCGAGIGIGDDVADTDDRDDVGGDDVADKDDDNGADEIVVDTIL